MKEWRALNYSTNFGPPLLPLAQKTVPKRVSQHSQHFPKRCDKLGLHAGCYVVVVTAAEQKLQPGVSRQGDE